jgi:hypothetical protein
MKNSILKTINSWSPKAKAMRTGWFGKKTKVCVENVIEVKYDGVWQKITFVSDKSLS